MQYMLQHSIWNGKNVSSQESEGKAEKFIATHSPVYFPGNSLKKIAIAEMRHAEKIAERITLLGGDIRKEVPPYSVGDSVKEILEMDKVQEEEAIELYTRIISIARKEKDIITEKMFQKILADEKGHHKVFTKFLNL